MGSALLGWVFFHFSHVFPLGTIFVKIYVIFFGTAPSTRTFSETRLTMRVTRIGFSLLCSLSICLMIFGRWLVYANKRSGDLQEPRLFVFLCDLARSEV